MVETDTGNIRSNEFFFVLLSVIRTVILHKLNESINCVNVGAGGRITASDAKAECELE